MKNRSIVLLGLALSCILGACVSMNQPAMQDESSGPEQLPTAAAEPVQEEAAPLDSASAAPVEPSSTAPAAAARVRLPAQYMIQSGDSFRVIAARPGIYWNETLWQNIYNANRAKIANPDVILPGTLLLIPPLRDEIREGMWEANRDYENPFGAGVSSSKSANTTAPLASANTRQTPAATQAPARTPVNTLVRRNLVSCKIAGIERADEISYITLDWAGLNNANGEGMNVKIEAYTTNNILAGTIVLENSHGYGRWNRYFSVSGEFLTAYSSWNDRIDFAFIENNSVQIEHESMGNVFLRMELDGSPFRN